MIARLLLVVLLVALVLAVERRAIARARNSPEAFARVLWGTGPNQRAEEQAA